MLEVINQESGEVIARVHTWGRAAYWFNKALNKGLLPKIEVLDTFDLPTIDKE